MHLQMHAGYGTTTMAFPTRQQRARLKGRGLRAAVLSHLADTFRFIPLMLFVAACSTGDVTEPIGSNEPTANVFQVTLTGLPVDVRAPLTLRGNGISIPVTPGAPLPELEPGTYTLFAESFTVDGVTYDPWPSSQPVSLSRGRRLSVTVSFSRRAGNLSVAVEGLPQGVDAEIFLSPPQGAAIEVSGDKAFANAATGRWQMMARSVESEDFSWDPSPAAGELQLAPGESRSFRVSYAAATGALKIVVSGLPADRDAGITVSGPLGFHRVVNSTVTLRHLAPGHYTISAPEVHGGSKVWSASQEVQQATVEAGAIETAGVSYETAAGSLSVSVSGLPPGTSSHVRVSGPLGYSETLTLAADASERTLTGLVPGDYTIAADPVSSAAGIWAASPASVQRTVTAGGSAGASIAYELVTGSIAVSIGGLPAGQSGSVQVSGPSGYSKTVTGTTTLTGLTPGNYTLSAASVSVSGTTWSPSPASVSRTVTASVTAQPASFTYAAVVTTGTLDVSVSGLPGGTAAAITVTGPGGYSKTITGTATLDGLTAGSYTVTAAQVSNATGIWAVSPASVQRTVTAGGSVSASMAYQLVTGSIAVSIGGLPAGQSGSVQVSGPSGYSKTVTGTTTLTGLTPGNYTLSAASVSVSGTTWSPSPASVSRTVTASPTAQTASFTYAAVVTTGSLEVTVSGLPGGTTAAITVTGPGGYSKSITATTTLTGLTAGSYTVNAAQVSNATGNWAVSPASVQRTVTAGGSVSASMAYALVTGSIAVSISGLPSGQSGSVQVSGPSGYSKTVTGTTTLTGLTPGNYTLSAASVNVSGTTWAPSPASISRTVTASPTAQPASFTYAAVVTTGTLEVSVSGLPGGSAAAITVTGPGGYSKSITATTTLNGLAAGSYTVTAAQVSNATGNWAVSPASVQRTVTAGGSVSASMAYALVTGSIAVSISGLPAGQSGSVQISGPSGYSQTVTGTTTLTGLTPGNYTLSAASVAISGTTWAPSPASISRTVTASLTAQPASFTYTASTPPPADGNDLSIAFAYVTQAVQRQDGTVPLVAEQPALLRVFGINSKSASITPAVRARIYNGSTLLRTATINAPEAAVRTAPAEGVLTSSWNVPLTAAEVKPGLKVLVDIDPSNSISESDETNNVWPANGQPSAVTVYYVPTLNVRLIPVLNNGLTGDVTEANKDVYVTALKQMLPVGTVNVTVGGTFTSNAAALTSGGTNWSAVLGEIYNLRTAQGSAATYYGVVKVNYGSGVAGLGYVGAPAAIGWDNTSGGTNTLVAAHELGHTFGRWHSPCSVSSGLQAGYPYAGGVTGQYGYSASANKLYAPNAGDIMGYCFSNTWISDFTWEAVMQFRGVQGAPAYADASPGGLNPYADSRTGSEAGGLMVSANVTGGRIELGASFRVPAMGSVPPRDATHMVEALDRTGRVIASVRAEAMEIDHESGTRHLAAVLPWSEQMEDALVSVRVRDIRNPLSVATARSIATPTLGQTEMVLPEPASTTVESIGAGRVRINLGAGYRDAMVRDGVTGEILGFVRNGEGEVSARPGRSLDIVYSDGVRSVTRRYQR